MEDGPKATRGHQVLQSRQKCLEVASNGVNFCALDWYCSRWLGLRLKFCCDCVAILPSMQGIPDESRLGMVVPLIGRMPAALEQARRALWGYEYGELLMLQ